MDLWHISMFLFLLYCYDCQTANFSKSWQSFILLWELSGKDLSLFFSNRQIKIKNKVRRSRVKLYKFTKCKTKIEEENVKSSFQDGLFNGFSNHQKI